MSVVQLGGLVLAALGLLALLAAPAAWLARAVLRLLKRPTDRWDGFFARWPARFVILGIVGLALGYGMMWGPSLVVGAKADRAGDAQYRPR